MYSRVAPEAPIVGVVYANPLWDLGCPRLAVHAKQALRLNTPVGCHYAGIFGKTSQRGWHTHVFNALQERLHALLVANRIAHER